MEPGISVISALPYLRFCFGAEHGKDRIRMVCCLYDSPEVRGRCGHNVSLLSHYDTPCSHDEND